VDEAKQSKGSEVEQEQRQKFGGKLKPSSCEL
jgi:hypothetical protein